MGWGEGLQTPKNSSMGGLWIFSCFCFPLDWLKHSVNLFRVIYKKYTDYTRFFNKFDSSTLCGSIL